MSELYRANDDLYSVERTNDFLDETKGKNKYRGFFSSVVWARKTYNHTVITAETVQT